MRIELTSSTRLTPALRARIVAAARAALAGIPRPLFKKKVGKAKELSLSLALVGPAAMKKLNKHYRGKNKPTDVLSFSRMEGFALPTVHKEIGEVILCLAVARRQAKEAGSTLSREVQMLTIHGVLHLFGYDHEVDEKEARKMFRLQDKILASLPGRRP